MRISIIKNCKTFDFHSRPTDYMIVYILIIMNYIVQEKTKLVLHCVCAYGIEIKINQMHCFYIVFIGLENHKSNVCFLYWMSVSRWHASCVMLYFCYTFHFFIVWITVITHTEYRLCCIIIMYYFLMWLIIRVSFMIDVEAWCRRPDEIMTVCFNRTGQLDARRFFNGL